MANTASRLSANGSLTISGSFDEVSGTYVSSGLLGSWDANRSYYPEIDASTWYDIAGNNNIKIFNNNSTPALFSPSSNSANITFSTTSGGSASLGSYGQITIPQLATAANVTIEGVLNLRQITGMVGGFGYYDIWTAGGTLGFNTFFGDVYGISAATVTSLNLLNRNVHYVFVMPTSNLPGAYQLWINGVQQSLSLVVGTGTATTRAYNSFDGTYKFQLNGSYIGTPINGTLPSTGTYYGNVSWSSFRMYNRVLTPAEIQQNYNIASARYRLGSTVNPIVTATRSNNTTQTIIQTISGEFDEVTYNPTANVAINLFNYTQDFSNAYWDKRLTITSTSALAPDNTYTATLFTYNLIYALVQTQTLFTNTFGKTYTFSCYVKATTTEIALVTTTAQCNYNVSNGTISGFTGGTPKITREANGFYRCSLTFTSNSTTEGFGIWLGGYNGSVWTGQTMTVWGPQVEVNSVVTPYQAKGASGLLRSNTAMKTTNTGNTFIKNTYDEATGVLRTTDGLIFYFDAAKDESYPGTGSTWLDLTPNKLNATPNGLIPPVWDYATSSFSYQAGKLTQQPLILPVSTLLNSTSFTYEAWVMQRDFNTNNEYNNQLFGREVYLTSGFRCGVTADGRPVFWTSQSGGTFFVYSSITTTRNRFYQLVVSYNSTTGAGTMYINGVVASTGTGTYIVPPANIQLGIGGGIGGTYDQIGNIGTFIMYNRSLSQQEVVDNFNGQRIRFGI